MQKLAQGLLFVAGLWAAGCTAAGADDDAMTASVKKAISNEKILSAGNQFNVSLFPQTHEAIVTAYADTASKDLQKDCKIDAVLLARQVIQTDPQIVRVKARFYHQNRVWYREVAVTKADIVAFSKGSVNKEELLNSLEVKKYDSSVPGTTKEVASYTSATSTVAAAGNVIQFQDKGLNFSYPRSWGNKAMNNQWGDFCELTFSRKSWCSIICRVQDKPSPEVVAEEDDKYYWQSHQRKIVGKKNIEFGKYKNLRGLMVYIKDDSNPSDLNRFEKHLYFGPEHRIYSLSIRFCKDDYAAVEQDLNTILSTMTTQ